MLTLILEIWLTIRAWGKGWRGRALLPLGAILGGGFILGLALGAAGGRIEDVLVVGIAWELIWLGVLIRLAVKGPRSAELEAGPVTGLSISTPAPAESKPPGMRAAA